MVSEAKNAVFTNSEKVEPTYLKVHGFEWSLDFSFNIKNLLQSFESSGFQATQIGRAISETRKMFSKKQLKNENKNFENLDDCVVWLSFTSNLISSGLRELFVFLAKNEFIDVIVTSAGGIEEDFIKCLAPTYIGEFSRNGKELRSKGWNRIGNLFVPNDNYCSFENWIQPLLDECLKKQEEERFTWTPSKLINFLGNKIDHESSLYYWCAKNKIPVFCPGITDGALGDNLFFHSYRNPGLKIDVVEDIRMINDIAIHAKKSGIIILGGGIAKHHTCNANLMRNGADYAIYVSTAQEYDGSDSGAHPDEAVSWGKIREDANPVKVHCDATVAFPLIIAGALVS